MTVVETIKADILKARKAQEKQKVTILTTLLADVEKIGKDDGNRPTADAEAYKVVQNYLSTLDDLKQWKPDNEELKFEIELLKGYLPKMMTRAEMEAEVPNVIQELDARSMGDMSRVMNVFRERFAGRYDGAFVAQAVKEYLNAAAD